MNRGSSRPSGAGRLVEILHGYGIDHVFCSPGSEWPPLWEELARRTAQGAWVPRYYNVRHEEVAVPMAAGYAKATGRLPAVLLHTTVGTLHAAMAMRAACHEEVPMLLCAGESIDFGEKPGFDPGGQWVRYLADRGGPTRFAEPVAKWSLAVNSPAILGSTLHRACQIAMTAPRGPVFVSVPFEFLFEDALGEPPSSFRLPDPVAAAPALLDEAAALLARSRRPLIITETAGRDVAAVAALIELAEMIGAPVVESLRQMYMNFPRAHALHGGFDPAPYLADADVVFLVGAVAPWHPPSAGPGAHTRIVALDVNPLRTASPYSGYRIDVSLAGDVSLSLAALVSRVHEQLAHGAGVDDARARDARVQALGQRHEERRGGWHEDALAAASARPIDPRWFCHVLGRVLPDDAIVLEETITHRTAIVRSLERVGPGRYFGAESGGLGLGMGFALGLACAAPDALVVALIGDGTFNYNPVVAALGFSQEYARPTLTIVMNNAGYLSMKRGITSLYPEGWSARTETYHGWAITPNPRYAALAAAFDGHGETVEDPDQVEGALRRAIAAVRAGRPAIVDVRLAPNA